MYSSVAANIGIAVFFGESMARLWSLLNLLQIISYLPLMTAFFPDHVQVMFSMLEFANMDIAIFSESFKTFIMIDGVTQKAFNDRFEDNEIEGTLFLDN
jgi:hypothetical protein